MVPEKYGSSGRGIPGAELVVRPPDGSPRAPGEGGEGTAEGPDGDLYAVSLLDVPHPVLDGIEGLLGVMALADVGDGCAYAIVHRRRGPDDEPHEGADTLAELVLLDVTADTEAALASLSGIAARLPEVADTVRIEELPGAALEVRSTAPDVTITTIAQKAMLAIMLPLLRLIFSNRRQKTVNDEVFMDVLP